MTPSKPAAPDMINHPPHYKGADGIETIDVIEDWGLGFHLGNAVKYILRYRNKGGVADLKKARWYVARVAHNPPRPYGRKAAIGFLTVAQAFCLPRTLDGVLGWIWVATEWPTRVNPQEALANAIEGLDAEIARMEPPVEPVEPRGSSA